MSGIVTPVSARFLRNPKSADVRRKAGRGSSRRDNNLPDSRSRNIEHEALVVVRDGRMEREDEEVVGSESGVAVERVGKAANRLQRGEEDEDRSRERHKLLLVEAEVLEEKDDEVVVDRVVVQAFERDARLLRV